MRIHLHLPRLACCLFWPIATSGLKNMVWKTGSSREWGVRRFMKRWQDEIYRGACRSSDLLRSGRLQERWIRCQV